MVQIILNRVTCKCCSSLLEFDKSDVKVSIRYSYGKFFEDYYINCPKCRFPVGVEI